MIGTYLNIPLFRMVATVGLSTLILYINHGRIAINTNLIFLSVISSYLIYDFEREVEY